MKPIQFPVRAFFAFIFCIDTSAEEEEIFYFPQRKKSHLFQSKI